MKTNHQFLIYVSLGELKIMLSFYIEFLEEYVTLCRKVYPGYTTSFRGLLKIIFWKDSIRPEIYPQMKTFPYSQIKDFQKMDF